VNRHFLAVVVESAGGGAFVVVPIEKVSLKKFVSVTLIECCHFIFILLR
jgi:Domain of unknown function (DUF1899)